MSELSDANTDAIFYLANYPFYVYDGGDFRSRTDLAPADVRRLPRSNFWRHAYTSRPVRIFWVLELSNATDSIGEVEKRVVYTNPFEKTIIYEAAYPAGFRWSEP